jgi:hypothetical protein
MRWTIVVAFACFVLCTNASIKLPTDPIDPVTRAGAQQLIQAAMAETDFVWQRLAYVSPT